MNQLVVVLVEVLQYKVKMVVLEVVLEKCLVVNLVDPVTFLL